MTDAPCDNCGEHVRNCYCAEIGLGHKIDKPTTPQQGQDAPETIWARTDLTTNGIHVWDDGYWSIREADAMSPVHAYTRKDIADAEAAHAEQRFNEAAEVQDREIFKRDKRIAELEAANQALQAQKMRLIETQPDLAAD